MSRPPRRRLRGAHAAANRPENAVFPCIWIVNSAIGASARAARAFPAAGAAGPIASRLAIGCEFSRVTVPAMVAAK
jgi:hypothetical protein